ncbi:MAG: LmbU family transcriptional regulator [Solirubrobacterales bacterium]|nr:LmbU family transcriptional regulator [Solirubrobacterales bacterium]
MPSSAELQAARPVPAGRAVARRARGVRSTRTAVAFDPLLPYDDWCALGARIGMYSTATAWWLGDWLLFGRMKYGRRYKDAVADTGLDYQTLRNYAMVARRFAPERRRPALTFQHHAEVCALDDLAQDHWLDQAAAHGWSRNELRRRVRAALATADGAPADVVRLTIDPARVARWRSAAERSDCDLGCWILQVLDDAAR